MLKSFTTQFKLGGEGGPPDGLWPVVRTCKYSHKLQNQLANFHRVESCPEGYPHLAAFLDSDENFMQYRRFGYLQSRLLLYKQDELRSLEEELDCLDKEDDDNIMMKRYLKSRDLDAKRGGERIELLQKIETKFKEYGKL
jgi:hypothetical protein